ncbi:MAG TPA: hypothetical protein VIL65_16080 [Beijerinckiaceae bacterium]
MGAGPLGSDAAGPWAARRPLAGFVTQLLACAANLPPYRPRRRAEPREASEAYGGDGREAPARPLLDRSF